MAERDEEILQARPEDRLDYGRGRGGGPKLLIAIGLVLVLVVLGYVFFVSRDAGESEQPPSAISAVQPAPVPALPPAPDIPRVEPVVESADAAGEEPPAEPVDEQPELNLDNSDPEVNAALAGAGAGELLANAMTYDHLLERGVAVVESASRGQVLYKLLRIDPPREAFPVVEVGEILYLDPAGYRRYDDYASTVEGLDTERLVAMFHTFRPLLELAFADQGFAANEFDNTLIRALDRILATPRLADPPAVEPGIKVYNYVDPELERLPDLEKQLLRMGPDNTARIQAQAAALRNLLLDTGQQTSP